MKIEMLKQFSVFLPNKPGALSRVISLFTAEGINILGIASEVRDDSGIIRIAVEDKPEANSVLTRGGCICVETHLLSVELADQPGALDRIAKAFGEHGVNITTVYGTSIGSGVSRILFAVDEAEKARRALASIQTSVN